MDTLVAICTPNMGTIRAACTRAILMAQNACHTQSLPVQFLHVDVETVIVGKARSLLARMALDCGAHVVLFVDEDVVIPPHAIVALLSHNLPIVGGFYIGRRMLYLPQIYTTEGTEGCRTRTDLAVTTPRQVYWPIVDYPEEPQLIKVDAVGAGCLMIRREVFERLAALQREQDALLQETLGLIEDFSLSPSHQAVLREHVRVLDPWFEFLADEGEDMYFCRKARQAGYEIHCDLGVKCQHLGIVPIEEGHFKFLKPLLQKEEAVWNTPSCT